MKSNEKVILAKVITRFNKWIKTFCIAGVLLCTPFLLVSQSYEVIPSGSFIIDMGVSPQTVDNALKPYGLIYELVSQHQVPIKWSINSLKAKDGVDFYYNGATFRGGPFIILAEYRTATVNSVIASWQGQGVVGITTISDIVVPITTTLDFLMIWTLDLQNGHIVESYLENAGIPPSAYNWSLPQDLGCCNDIFLMPHADPTWATHERLLEWNNSYKKKGCRGTIWAACHAVSALENLYNPSKNKEQMNFLSEDLDTIMGSPYARNSLILWDEHEDGEPPFSYDYHGDPVMQFLGTMDDAVQNGSEQIFIPLKKWRKQTKVAVWDPDNEETSKKGEAALVAYGKAFGKEDRGNVMYMAGHNHNHEVDEPNIAVQRAMFNFSIWSAAEKSITVSTDFGSSFNLNQPDTLRVIAEGGSDNFTFEWSTTCSGTFSNPYSSTTIFTPTAVGDCQITVVVTDDCGRTSFATVPVTIYNNPQPPAANNDLAITSECTPTGIDVLLNDTDPEGGTLAVTLLGTGLNGTFVNTGTGVINYTPDNSFTGTDSVAYEVCDPTALCDTAIITVTVNNNTAPIANDDAVSSLADSPLMIDVLANDSDPEGSNLSINILTQPADGTVSVVNGAIQFLPDAGFIGLTTFTYEACDDACTPICDPAMVTVDVGCTPVAGQANILGAVYLDQNANGILEGGENGQSDVTVSLYEDINGDGLLDGGDLFVNTQNTNTNGTYQFTLNSLPNSNQVTSIVNVKSAESYEASNDKNSGLCDEIYVSEDVGEISYSFIEFDLSSISSCSVSSAILELTRGVDGRGDDFSFEVRRVTNSWTEGTGDCTVGGTDLSGLTWNQRAPGTNWSTPGGDFAATIYATGIGGDGDPTGTKYSLDITTLVNEWLDGTYDNYGLILMSSAFNTSGGEDYFTFYSDDAANAADRPVLDITYSCTANYLVHVDESTLPAGNPFMISSNPQSVAFDSLGSVACSVNFGFDLSNNPPVAVFDTDTTEVNIPKTVVAIANDYDLDGDSIYVNEITIAPYQCGSALLNPDGTITYFPPPNFAGLDTLSYSICDDGTPVLCDTNEVEIVIYPYSNDPPIAVNDYDTTEVNTEICVQVLLNDSDPEGDNINPPVSAGTDGLDSLTVQGGFVEVDADGHICYTPPTGFVGDDEFDYIICDPSGLCDTATVYIHISVASNDPPIARADYTNACTNDALSYNVLENDYDIDGLLDASTLSILTNGANGTAIGNADSTITYTSNIGFTGLDSVTYQICDDGIPLPVQCTTAKIYFTVYNTNSPPVGVADSDTTHINEAFYLNVLDNDSDPENGMLSVVINTPPANGTATVLSNGLILYQPNSGYFGTDNFTYNLCDDGCPQECVVVAVNLFVENQAPIAIDDYRSTGIDMPITIDVMANDIAPDGGAIELISAGTDVVNNATNQGGTLSLDDNGTPGDLTDDQIYYTPPPGYSGLDTFRYRICDQQATPACDTAFVFIDIRPTIDLELGKTANRSLAVSGDTVLFTISIQNVSANVATGVLVRDVLPDSVLYLSDDGSGAFDPVSGVWYIGTLAAGANTNLMITAQLINDGATNVAEVFAANEYDIDSTPNNNDPTEDDQDMVIIYFPENCTDGLDNDGDGLSDCFDPECGCCLSRAPKLIGVRKKN